jgi:para-nitrobenzyl esterase
MTSLLAGGADGATAVARRRLGAAPFDRLLAVYTGTARPGEDPLRSLLTDEMWLEPVRQLALAQTAAGGRAWLSRWDHAPSLPPFDELGPTHGADNACLWAAPPRFVERPLLARPGGSMSPADRTVTEALHEAVLSMARTGSPAAGLLAGWPTHAPDAHCTAVFDAVPRVLADPAAQRRRAWAELSR